MNFEPGSKIGDYEVLGNLGAGGMGRVYKVRNDLSDRVEAMKVLLPDLEGHADLANRFLREIKVQAGLDHPNIAKLYTALRIDNQLLMCMELVEGITLDQRLREGPVPLVDGLDYMVQVLGALEYAHQRGVVHRDIKPANMMLMPDGRLKLLDFGIAKATANTGLTVTGTTMGSLYYMSPEQIQGGMVDMRSDLYSVGVSLYELMTGKRPFEAESQFGIMSAHLARPPVPPIELNPSLLPAVNDIILTALAKEPAVRFQTAGAFLQELRDVQAEVGYGSGTVVSLPAARRSLPGAVPPPGDSRRVTTVVQGVPAQPPSTPGPKERSRAEPAGAPQKKSRPRLLWVALGSLCAVGAIVAFIQFGPKGQSAKETAPAGFTPPYPGDLTKKPSAMPPAATRPAVSGDPRDVRKKAPAQRPQVQSPAQPAPPQQRQSAPPAAAPAQAPPAQVQQQAPPSAPAMSGPRPGMVNADRIEIQRLSDRLSLMYTRAKAVRDALMDQQSKQAQGADPRADLVESFNRVNLLLKQATQGINDGNAAAATAAMLKADHELEVLEKALGK